MDLTYKQEVGVGAIVLVTVGVFLAAMFLRPTSPVWRRASPTVPTS